MSVNWLQRVFTYFLFDNKIVTPLYKKINNLIYMNDDERFQEIKEKEITRLTTPISYPKIGNFSLRVVGAKDCEGNPVPMIRGFRNRFVLEPKPEYFPMMKF